MPETDEKLKQYREMRDTICSISRAIECMVRATTELYASRDFNAAAQQAEVLESAGLSVANIALAMQGMCEELESED